MIINKQIMSGYKRVNFYELCRLCATNQQRHVTTHIFKEEGKRLQLQDKIHNCLSLKVEEDDFLPKVVCSKCLGVLEQSNSFRKECVKSELMLSTYYNNFRYTPDFTESGKVYIKDISTPMLPNLPCILQNQTIIPSKTDPPKLVPKPSSNSTFTAVNTHGDIITILECSKSSTPKIMKVKKVSSTVQNIQSVKQTQNSVLVDNSNVPYVSPPKKQRIKIESKQHIIPAPHPQQINNTQTLDIDLDSIQKDAHVNHGNNVYHQLKAVTISPTNEQQLTTLQNQTTFTAQYLDQPQYVQFNNAGGSSTSQQHNNGANQMQHDINSNNQWLSSNQNQDNLNQQHNVIITSSATTMAASQVQTSTALTVNNDSNTRQQQIISNIGINIQQHQKVLPKIEPVDQKYLTTINLDSISTTGSGNNGNLTVTTNMTPTTSGGGYSKVKKEPLQGKHYTCDVCAKVFKRREHLYQHMKLHSGFRPFACAVCGKTFMRKEHLLRHQTSHSGQKNYTCSVCDKSFSRNDNLLKHKKTHDKQVVQYECDICPKVFVLKHYYITHKLTHEMQANQKQHTKSGMVTTNTSNCWQGQQNTAESLKA